MGKGCFAAGTVLLVSRKLDVPLMVTSAAQEAVRGARSPPGSALLLLAAGMLFPVGMCCSLVWLLVPPLCASSPCCTPRAQPHGTRGEKTSQSSFYITWFSLTFFPDFFLFPHPKREDFCSHQAGRAPCPSFPWRPGQSCPMEGSPGVPRQAELLGHLCPSSVTNRDRGWGRVNFPSLSCHLHSVSSMASR